MDDSRTDTDSALRLSAAGHPLRSDYLLQKLQQAELMLAYAAEVGMELDPQVAAGVMNARMAESEGKWTAGIAKDLLECLTMLSSKLRPVTVDSVRLCPNSPEASKIIRFYRRAVITLAVLIVPFSFLTFVGGALSKTITQDLESANKLAVAVVSAEDGSASAPQAQKGRPEALQNLQEFAANTRSLYAHAKQLDLLLFNVIAVPYAGEKTDANNRKDILELPPDLINISEAAIKRVAVYQGIRYFAQTVQGSVTTIYGAFSACVLPVLYALLGACAYMLREFEQQARTRTLSQSYAHIAHFIVAAISGAVVGLFGNVTSDSGSATPFNFGQGSLFSPLAMAFLVGYAVDVFFAFLEGLIQSFSRGRTTASPGPQTPSSPPR